MIEDIFSRVTHDDKTFENQYWNIIREIQQMLDDATTNNNNNLKSFKVKCLDGLINYVLTETDPNKEKSHAKKIFVENVVQICAENPLPPLEDIVRIILRVIDREDIYNRWFLNCITAFHYKFKLCYLLSGTESFHLIDLYLKGLKKHSFLNGQTDETTQSNWKEYLSRQLFSPLTCDENKLNYEKNMLAIRTTFQQIFRHAARLSHQSSVWESIIFVFMKTLPTLFHDYANPEEAKVDFLLCVEPPICSDYILTLTKAYESNENLIKENSIEVLFVVERLLLLNQISDARQFVIKVILTHIQMGINIEDFLQMLIRVCPLIEIDYRKDFCKIVFSEITYKIKNIKCPKSSAILFFDLTLALLNLKVPQAPACAEDLLSKNEFYPWKDLASRFTDLIRLCVDYDTIIDDKISNELDKLASIILLIAEKTKAFPILYRSTHSVALAAVLKWSHPNTNNKLWSPFVYRMGEYMVQLIDQRQITHDICDKFIESLIERVTLNETEDNDISNRSKMNSLFTCLASTLSNYIDQLKTIPFNTHRHLSSLVFKCIRQPLRYENGQRSLEYAIADRLWRSVCCCLNNEADVRLYESCIEKIYSIASDEDEIDFFQWWSMFWLNVSRKAPDFVANYIERILEDVLKRKDNTIATILQIVYSKCFEAFHIRLNDILNELDYPDIGYGCALAHVVSLIAQNRPQLFEGKQLDRLIEVIQNRNESSADLYFLFQSVTSIVNYRPGLLDKHRSIILRFVNDHQNISAMICLKEYLIASSIVNGQQSTNEYFMILFEILKTNQNLKSEIRSHVCYTFQSIGIIDKQTLNRKRDELIPYESYSEFRTLIDFIDGNKMSEENQTLINRTQDEVTKIQQRVVKTEQNVQNMTDIVKTQETDINNLGKHIESLDNQLADVAEQVVIQSHEIERIDAKTLSHVPLEWGRQVCKILNQRANNDWRLLGKRFGYSTNELRHWSMQADPTMALLNEWFMTHKTDEATYGLIKILGEIDREDAAKIIRESLSVAGQLIPDDMPVEIKRTPPVFLSYQWGVQQSVFKLKQHLEEAGYACWMDTGQMGGGDKLFSKIDAGIRGAKVVICCMNLAYAQSDNCSREVHLTVSTGKPLIPLQMEKQKWPPEGAMGPIMSEYLFIRFYDRKGNDPNFWPTDKFAELLGQIRYHVAPNPDIISDRYRNWFVPRVDNLIFLQSSNATTTTINDQTPIVVTHPQIMISYQWDRQSDIIALYNRLAQLGYRCWLDIFQMGGGDSLFEKIDQGIRHAKCVLACVTPKYIISVNCRREMSLADALKKPIIPLYLEETSTWPPPGPMAMVFTNRTFLDFRQNTGVSPDNDLWKSKEFDKVLIQLRTLIPEVKVETSQRHLLEMKRPTTATKELLNYNKRSTRVNSAPINPQSRACLLM